MHDDQEPPAATPVAPVLGSWTGTTVVCPRCRREFKADPAASELRCPRTPPCHWRGTLEADGTLKDAPDLETRDT